LKALFVIDNLSTGGAQRQMVNLAIELHKRNHSVIFFCYSPGDLLAGPLTAEGIPIITALKNSRFSLNIFLSLRRTIMNGNFDIILSFLQTPNFYAIISRQLLLNRPRLVISERSNDVNPIGLFQQAIRVFYRLVDHIVVNSYSQQENFRSKYRWTGKKISTIYNGLDLEKFNYVPPVKENDPIKILVIASVRAEKNGMSLIEALHILRGEDGYCPLVRWVGQKVLTGEHLAYLKRMEGAISRYGLSEQWFWLGQRDDIPELIHDHDILVLASSREGLPNVVCEALACGRPVIVSNILDNPRLVQDGVTGFLFDWKDARSLADSIRKYRALSIAERNEMGLKARQFAEKQLSIARMTAAYEQLFTSLIG
jgi:glycosyltransferase involved in cell wall biosynthesis